MISPDRLLAEMRRLQYVRTLTRFVGPFVGFEVRDYDNDNFDPARA